VGLTRRQFGMIASALILGRPRPSGAGAPREVSLVLAPSNLGLRPENGREPGTWQAPRVLMGAGLRDALSAREVFRLGRPVYQFDAQPGTRIRNGHTMRTFSIELAHRVRDVIASRRFPVVIGGDCSVLLGALYGARLAGGRGLVHVDGHSDFSQASSYATPDTLGAAAGMDLALATGRGEAVVTDWPDVGTPLVADADAIQVGERGAGEAWFEQFYGEIRRTAISMITVQSALAEGIGPAAGRVLARLVERGLDRAWLHVDLDVLDESVMPAVDSPGKPGFDFAQLSELVGLLVASGRVVGANFSIYDPDRDPERRYARPLVECIAGGIRPQSAAGAKS
jgi:arginase